MLSTPNIWQTSCWKTPSAIHESSAADFGDESTVDEVLDRLGVQWVFFAGEWRGALTLIRSLKAMNPTHINFILSDAAASPELLANGGADVEGIYVMHQLKAKDFRDQGYGVYAKTRSKS